MPGVQRMPDPVVPVADSVMTMFLRMFRTGAHVRAAIGVVPGSVFHCLAKWCAFAGWSYAEDNEEDLDEDDENDEVLDDDDDDDFDDEEFLDDEDDEDLDDDEDDEELPDVDEINIERSSILMIVERWGVVRVNSQGTIHTSNLL